MNEIIETQNTLPAHLAGRIAELRAKAQHAPEVWEPIAWDCLVGQLIGSQKASGLYGENDQVLVKTEDGTIVAAWLTQWLRENLKAQGATGGDLIAITYLGKKQSPSGRIYNSYSLLVDSAEVQ
jgi:hypothetical protein